MPFNLGRGSSNGNGARTSTRSVALFTVGGVDYAIDAERVRHLVPAGRETGQAVVFEGVTYRLIDLRTLFRLPAIPRAGRVLLVDDGGSRTGALVADNIATLACLEERALTPLPPVFRGHERVRFEALAVLEDRIVVVVAARGLQADAWPTRVAV